MPEQPNDCNNNNNIYIITIIVILTTFLNFNVMK